MVKRDNKYLEFIRMFPCRICGTVIDIVAHHIPEDMKGSVGMKCSDYRTVPLCVICHSKVHNKGKGIWRRTGIDIEIYIQAYRKIYETRKENHDTIQ